MIKREYVNVPNTLSVSRVVFLPLLYVFLVLDWRMSFVVAYVLVGATDFFDGICARKLNQKTEIGKTLDSVADIFFYFSSAYFLYYFFKPVITANLGLLNTLFVMIGLSFIISAVKFRKPIMMHSRLLRLGGLLVYFLIIFSFFWDTTLFTAFTISVYLLGFGEEILIFLLYGNVDRDTQTIWHASQQRRKA